MGEREAREEGLEAILCEVLLMCEEIVGEGRPSIEAGERVGR